ncbi:DUF4349 domain-containing protein [Pedobacter sp. JY14-1]|uniref:DUF4349 domain-containing protein n=1 Tax=Pedobacter sp. JY14-1 TaxID=3034151 RepID=UPI0023E192AF|nr:DUF4349 domain-containing protein [Pedobacter sp. JY14-1]
MKKILFCCIIAIAAIGCANEKRPETADTTSAIAESPDTTLTDKIVKTADMRFRVKDVQKTKERLSGLIKAEGGSLSEFSIQSQIQNSEKVRYSQDSLVELTAYQTEGTLTAKIPSEKLDEFTNKIAGLAVFVDQQSLRIDNQKITYLANQLKNQNRKEAVEMLNKHANKKSNNVESSLLIKDDFIDKKIENMIIDDKVKFSTITLAFYQDNTLQRLMVQNDNLADYRAPFLNRLLLNLHSGWILFVEAILVIANLWMFILAGLGVYFLIKRYQRLKRAV